MRRISSWQSGNLASALLELYPGEADGELAIRIEALFALEAIPVPVGAKAPDPALPR